MKTCHELARELLALPDIVIVIYEPSSDEPIPHAPKAVHVQGYDLTGDDHEVIEMYGKCPVLGNPDAPIPEEVIRAFGRIRAN